MFFVGGSIKRPRGQLSLDNVALYNNCLRAKLEDILSRLEQDKSRWNFRRTLFMNKSISENFIPTLLYAKDDKPLQNITIRVLQELMTPVECLISMSKLDQDGEGIGIINEIEIAIASAKKLFLDPRVTKCLIDFADSILQKPKDITMHDCEMINHCLILIRNLFHTQSSSTSLPIESSPTTTSFKTDKSNTCNYLPQFKFTIKEPSCPTPEGDLPCTYIKAKEEYQENYYDNNKILNPREEDKTKTCSIMIEDQILWNLFAQRFDNILIKLLTCPQQHLWMITIVQLVALMYRDQQHGALRKLITEWLETSIYESSTDDENNTMSSSSYDEITTSDPVSDFSERGSPVEELISKNNLTSNVKNQSSNTLNVPDKISSKDSGLGRSSSANDSSVEDCWSVSARSCEKIKKSRNYDMEQNEDALNYKNLPNETITIIQTMFDDEGVNILTDHFNDDIKINCEPKSENNAMEFNYSSKSEKKLSNDMANNVFVTSNTKTDINFVQKPKSMEDDLDMNDKPLIFSLPKVSKTKSTHSQKRPRHCMSQKMMTETQEANNSTGSDCDESPQSKRPQYQKPHKILAKPRPPKLVQKSHQERNMKRTMLLRRKESNDTKAKALLHHCPTAKDISNLLKEFTVDFMLNGFSTLVQGLRLQVLLPYQINLDKSHLLWLITYFIRFAVELDLELSQINPVMSVEVVSYLVHEGVNMQEEIEIAIRNGETDLVPYSRRLHLVVTALREFFISLDVCLKKEPSSINTKELSAITANLGSLYQLRQIFVFLLRMYRPGVLNHTYLQDLINTNHRFLITQEHLQHNSFDIVAHTKQFATMDIMHQYGRVLKNFNNNDEMVNDCIFTMMHHISGELRAVNVLLQPSILKVFLHIWKESYELCVDWADLIEYVLRKCTRTQNTKSNLNHFTPESHDIQLTNEDLDHLYTLYSTFDEQDLMEKIKEICCDDSIEEPTKKEVIKKLLARGFITSVECSKLCAEIPERDNSMDQTRKLPKSHKRPLDVDSQPSEDFDGLFHLATDYKSDDSILEAKRFCLGLKTSDKIDREDIWDMEYMSTTRSMNTSVAATLHPTEEDFIMEEKFRGNSSSLDQIIGVIEKEGLGDHIRWLQHELLEACYAKLCIMDFNSVAPEPLFFHYTISNQSIPIVPWTSEQEEAITSTLFKQLLGLLGFHLPSDTGKLFTRIPHFWGPDVLFAVAKKLGPIDEGNLKFSLETLHEAIKSYGALNTTKMNHEQLGEWEQKMTLSLEEDCSESMEKMSDCSMKNIGSVSAVSSESEFVRPSQWFKTPNPPGTKNQEPEI